MEPLTERFFLWEKGGKFRVLPGFARLVVGTPVARRPPHSPGRCGFPASGSSVALASARIFTVTRYKTQLLFPVVRLARVYLPYMSGTSCFLCGLRTSVRYFTLWLAFPTSEYYA